MLLEIDVDQVMLLSFGCIVMIDNVNNWLL
jgi:hypothetical protein